MGPREALFVKLLWPLVNFLLPLVVNKDVQILLWDFLPRRKCLPCVALLWGQPAWQGLGFSGLVHEETHPCGSNFRYPRSGAVRWLRVCSCKGLYRESEKASGQSSGWPRAGQGPKLNISFTRSCVRRPTCQVSSTSAQRSWSLRVSKILTPYGRIFDRFYKSSRERLLKQWFLVVKNRKS